VASWADLTRSDPGLETAAHALLTVPGFGYGYLATVRRDGGPRVHPVMPFLDEGRLKVFVVPSPKLDDLRRDGRWALHSTGSETVSDELHLTGRAIIVDDPSGPRDPERRARAIVAYGRSVEDSHVLVELAIDRLLLAQYASPPRWPPTYRRWPDAPPPAGSA
jgi:hypothetical protein